MQRVTGTIARRSGQLHVSEKSYLKHTTSGFSAPLGATSAVEITRCIRVFTAKDMRLFSVIENEGIWLLVNTLEPKYSIPSCQQSTGKQNAK